MQGGKYGAELVIRAPKDNREKGRRAVRAGARAEEAGRRGAPPSPARGAPTVGGANRGEKCPTFPENRDLENPRVAPPGPLQHLQPAQPRRRRPLGCRIDWVPRPSTGRMDPVRPVRPRAASLPARLELAPQFLSSTFGPRSSYSGAPEAATKRQASPAPAASPAKKSSGARAWSPYHAYCKA